MSEEEEIFPFPSALPKVISNEPLPDYVYALTPANAAQPALVRWFCKSCIRSLTTSSKASVADSTVIGLAKAFLSRDFCYRQGSYGVCSGCRDAKVGACSEVRGTEVSPVSDLRLTILDPT
jgi:hypothetical protein